MLEARRHEDLALGRVIPYVVRYLEANTIEADGIYRFVVELSSPWQVRWTG